MKYGSGVRKTVVVKRIEENEGKTKDSLATGNHTSIFFDRPVGLRGSPIQRVVPVWARESGRSGWVSHRRSEAKRNRGKKLTLLFRRRKWGIQPQTLQLDELLVERRRPKRGLLQGGMRRGKGRASKRKKERVELGENRGLGRKSRAEE